MRTEAQRRADAEHEACHVVCAMALGIELEEVTLDGADPLAPHVRLASEPRIVSLNGKRRFSSWARTADEIVMTLAPLVHQCPAPPLALRGPLRELTAGDDLSTAKAMARAASRSAEEAEAMLWAMAHRAIGITSAPGFHEAWASVVDSLMRAGRLGGRALQLELERAQVASWAVEPPTRGGGYVEAA